LNYSCKHIVYAYSDGFIEISIYEYFNIVVEEDKPLIFSVTHREKTIENYFDEREVGENK